MTAQACLQPVIRRLFYWRLAISEMQRSEIELAFLNRQTLRTHARRKI